VSSLKSWVARLWGHWLSLLGGVLALLSGLGILVLVALEMAHGATNEYASFIILLALAALFLVGLLLIPPGLALAERNEQESASRSAVEQVLSQGPILRRLAFVGIVTVFIVMVLGLSAERTLHTLDSPLFCGTACHTPMSPEYTAWQNSPHGQVSCVTCHVGSGLGHTIRAKVDGSRRMVAVALNNFSRPIPNQLKNGRSAEDTCMKCHNNGFNLTNKLKVYPHYKDDKDNTPIFNLALLHLGKRNGKTGVIQGIHTHADPRRKVIYETTDDGRRRISRVKLVVDGKLLAEYARPNEKLPTVETRTMECLDCHNRPAHRFAADARDAVERAMYNGGLDAKLPYVRKAAVELLTAAHPAREAATAYFEDAVQKAYAKDYADSGATKEQLQDMATGLTKLYLRNVFPEMKLEFGTYKVNQNHNDEKDEHGCFRCHNSDLEQVMAVPEHKSKLGQDCETCHAMLATDENPAEFEDTLQMLVDTEP